MKKMIYIVSRFEGRERDFNCFHFIGYFNGVRIKKIYVRNGYFMIDEEYILAIEKPVIREGVLFGELVKSKLLFI